MPSAPPPSTLTNAASNVAAGRCGQPERGQRARSQRLLHRPAVPPAGRRRRAGQRTTQPTIAAKPAASSPTSAVTGIGLGRRQDLSRPARRQQHRPAGRPGHARVDQVTEGHRRRQGQGRRRRRDGPQDRRARRLPHRRLAAGFRRRRLLGGDEGRTSPRRRHRVRRRLRPLLIRRIRHASRNWTLAARRADLADHHHRALRAPLR